MSKDDSAAVPHKDCNRQVLARSLCLSEVSIRQPFILHSGSSSRLSALARTLKDAAAQPARSAHQLWALLCGELGRKMIGMLSDATMGVLKLRSACLPVPVLTHCTVLQWINAVLQCVDWNLNHEGP